MCDTPNNMEYICSFTRMWSGQLYVHQWIWQLYRMQMQVWYSHMWLSHLQSTFMWVGSTGTWEMLPTMQRLVSV